MRSGVKPTAKRKAARIFKRDAIPFVNQLEEGSYDVAFADPPYGSRKLDLVLERWKDVRFSRILAVEHEVDHEVPKGGKRLDFGAIRVTVYGIPAKRRKTWWDEREARRRAQGKSPTEEAG